MNKNGNNYEVEVKEIDRFTDTVVYGSLNELKEFDYGPLLKMKDSGGATPLDHAVEHGRLQVIEWILENKGCFSKKKPLWHFISWFDCEDEECPCTDGGNCIKPEMMKIFESFGYSINQMI